MKTAVKYFLYDLKKVIFIFFLVYTFFILTGNLLVATTDSSGSAINFNGTNSSIVLMNFILGLVVFKEYFWMFTQNGLSRKTYFKSCLVSFLLLDIGMAIISLILTVILQPLGFVSEDLTTVFLAAFYPALSENVVLESILNFLFNILIFYLSFILGYFLGTLFYRAGKFGKILIAAGLPVTLFVLLPVSYNFIAPFWNGFAKVLLTLLGRNTGNPLFSFLTFSLVTILLIICSYRLLKKAEIS